MISFLIPKSCRLVLLIPVLLWQSLTLADPPSSRKSAGIGSIIETRHKDLLPRLPGHLAWYQIGTSTGRFGGTFLAIYANSPLPPPSIFKGLAEDRFRDFDAMRASPLISNEELQREIRDFLQIELGYSAKETQVLESRILSPVNYDVNSIRVVLKYERSQDGKHVANEKIRIERSLKKAQAARAKAAKVDVRKALKKAARR